MTPSKSFTRPSATGKQSRLSYSVSSWGRWGAIAGFNSCWLIGSHTSVLPAQHSALTPRHELHGNQDKMDLTDLIHGWLGDEASYSMLQPLLAHEQLHQHLPCISFSSEKRAVRTLQQHGPMDFKYGLGHGPCAWALYGCATSSMTNSNHNNIL